MRPDLRARILGVVFLLPVIPVLLWVPEPAGGPLALALGASGAFLLVVVAERAVPAADVEAVLQGDAQRDQQLREAMHLSGRPVYAPSGEGGARMLWPTDDDERPAPVLDPETVVQPGPGAKAGLSLTPTGWTALRSHMQRAGNDLAGMDAAATSVRAWLGGAGIARGVDLVVHEEDVRARFQPDLRLPCQDDPEHPVCESTGCAACQGIGCAIAVAADQAVQVAEARVTEDRVELRFRRIE